MTWYTRHLKEDCTYWGPPNINAFGDGIYPSPAGMKCFYVDQTTRLPDASGVLFESNAIVLLSENIDPGGFLYRSAGVATTIPTALPGAQRIQKVGKVPSVRRDMTVYVAYL